MKVISVVGYKKSGKTSVVSALVRSLSGFGTVGTIKHMGEQSLNPAETDTGRHFDAGADVVIGITGSEATGTELVSFSRDLNLEDALDILCDQGLDFAVVEGFKESNLPKIVIGDLQGVSNVVFSLPADIDMHEELTASLVEMALAQPDRYTLEALIKKARKNPAIRKSGAMEPLPALSESWPETRELPSLNSKNTNQKLQKFLTKFGMSSKEKKASLKS